MAQRQILSETILEPGTGKAVEVKRGQILRISQIEGGQCVDFNCFNLHDYKEHFHSGRTRGVHGFHPTKGDFLWSAPPRERQMMFILEDTVGTNDSLAPRCSGFLFEYRFGLANHINCHDIQAEAQREYGLSPDDVHDSFNFFMHTGIDQQGRSFIAQQTAMKDDYVELLALMDVLAVPNVCGDDVMGTNDFSLKPIRLTLLDGLETDIRLVPEWPSFRCQRSPIDFKVKDIKADRPLRRDPSYAPEFLNIPIQTAEIPVPLDDAEAAALDALKRTNLYGSTDAEVLRYVFFSWYSERFMEGLKYFNPAAPQGRQSA